MQNSKRAKILAAAVDLFRLKGYTGVSMQDIAEACGMAKASIYKIFDSKEALFTAAFIACHETLHQRAAVLDREDTGMGLTPKEKLRRKIEFQLQYALENHLLMFDFKEQPIAENERFIAAWKNKKRALHAWYRELLFETYGPPVEPYIWDAVAIFRGIHNMYLTYVRQKVISIPMAELAAFIVDRIDAVIGEMIRSAPKPVIDADNAHFNPLNPSDPSARAATVRQLIGLMDDKIKELSQPDEVREELRQVTAMLGEACEREPSDRTQIRVFAAYLEREPELRPYVRHLFFLRS